ncbi:MAG TPA: DUF423 domain-containing protein [Alphaproteobacteria bacterium]|nr:DUF423 domain-containing protein [Alphaproteobacteria bacterium]
MSDDEQPMNPWFFIAALNGFSAVAAGAYGWHILAADDAGRQFFMIASEYQMWHALALFVVAWAAGEAAAGQARLVHFAGVSFTVGIILFSGSLYIFAVTGAMPAEGATPVGGIALLTGWAALIWLGGRTFFKR